MQFVAYEAEDKMRYYEWPAIFAIAEAYGVSRDTVFKDVAAVKEAREKVRKEARRAASRASNEERRLANLEKKAAL